MGRALRLVLLRMALGAGGGADKLGRGPQARRQQTGYQRADSKRSWLRRIASCEMRFTAANSLAASSFLPRL